MKQFLSVGAFISINARKNSLLFSVLICSVLSCQNREPVFFCASTADRKPAQVETFIVGGTNVPATTTLAKKVFYLALGVEITTQKNVATSLTSKSLCTSTAIAPRVLITAAHCVFDVPAEKTYVTLQKNPWGQPLAMKNWIRAKEIVMHPKYNHKDVKLGFDVALIHLERDLPDGSVTKLVQESPGTEFSIVSIGYGRTSILNDHSPGNVSKIPSILNMVDRKVQNYSVHDFIFVIDQKDHKGICFGDSGGPALFFDAKLKEYLIVGVTSYVSVFPDEKAKVDPENKMNSCIGQGHYSNILSYSDWIKSELLKF